MLYLHIDLILYFLKLFSLNNIFDYLRQPGCCATVKLLNFTLSRPKFIFQNI